MSGTILRYVVRATGLLSTELLFELACLISRTNAALDLEVKTRGAVWDASGKCQKAGYPESGAGGIFFLLVDLPAICGN